MRLKELSELLWKDHRGALLLLGLLLVMNVLLSVVLEQFVVPKVAIKEGLFLKRQAEVRQLLRKQGGAAETPEQLYVLANQDLSKFQQIVPEYRDFTALIEELLVLSNQARLNITQISYATEELKSSPLLKFNLNFNVAGDYEQVKKFIHSLEQSVRLITIKQINLRSVESDAVNLGLSLETLFRSGSRES
jgi:type IV pilus assembly protein PilO